MISLNKKNTINFFIFLSVVLGLFFPAPPYFKKAIPFLLAAILFFNFLKLDLKLEKFIRKELLYHYPLACLIVPSLVMFLAGYILKLDNNITIGLFLLAVTPTAIGAPIVADLIDGDRELAVAQSVLSNLLAPITFTLVFFIFFNNSEVTVPAEELFKKLFFLIFIPLAAVIAFKNSQRAKKQVIEISTWLTPILFVILIGIAVASSSEKIRAVSYIELIKIIVCTGTLSALLFITGYFLSSKSRIKKTLSVTSGHKNTALAIWIGLSNFNGAVLIPIVIYIVFHHIFNGILIHKFHK